jgi:hypothetical protein
MPQWILHPDTNREGSDDVCDFFMDAEAAAQIMVGRTLTLERVRQLNAKDYFFQMLKDNT